LTHFLIHEHGDIGRGHPNERDIKAKRPHIWGCAATLTDAQMQIEELRRIDIAWWGYAREYYMIEVK
jgi:hypothetical protein